MPGPSMRLACLAASAALAPGLAAAQSTGGIFGPAIEAGSSLAQARFGYRQGEDGAPDGFAQRYHWQAATGPDTQVRLIAQADGTTDDQRFSFVQAELYFDLSDDTDRFRQGLRLRGQARSGAAPETLALDWAGAWPLAERWSALVNVLAGTQIGDRAADGVSFETRASVTYRTTSDIGLGVEAFSPMGSTEDLDLLGRGQVAGPFAVLPVADGWSLRTGVLFGLTEDAPDADLRFWVTKSL